MLEYDVVDYGSTKKWFNNGVFLNAILSLKPQKVIYVSCDPTTLVRDLKVLEGAYKIENKTIVDMFVGTYHVETIVSMSLNRN